ncbi:MAG: YihY/virulence factor BrkB family protein [Ktedonobacterales bacterium]
MTTVAPHTPDMGRGRGGADQDIVKKARGLGERIAPLMAFWTKINNDWIFDFSGELAYSFLMSIFPILVAILGIIGLVLGAISSATKEQVINSIGNGLASALPQTGTGGQSFGHTIVAQALASFTQSAGVLFVFGLVVALFTGSRIFVTLEKQFGVIFRLRGRDPVHQNLMAIGMVLLYTVLVPVVLLGSTIPSAIISALHLDTTNPVLSFGYEVLGVLAGLVAALFLFAAIYIVVPNRPVKLKEVWLGTLVAAGLLVLYELLFPWYQSTFLKPGHYGAIFGYAIVLLVFFYYLGFIVLFGAEVNSWMAGQRQTAAPLEGILHELQAHNTTRGAAGPTAGNAQEDMQSGKGASAMHDTETAIEHEREEHQSTMQPPKYAESGITGSGYSKQVQSKEAIRPVSGRSERSKDTSGGAEAIAPDTTRTVPPESGYVRQQEELREQRRELEREIAATAKPLTPRQRGTLGAVVAVSVVALAPAVRYIGRFMFGDDERDDRRAMD